MEELVSMFRNATNFNQDLGVWDVSSSANFIIIFKSTSVSVENLDAILEG
jgi:hypothetical protein